MAAVYMNHRSDRNTVTDNYARPTAHIALVQARLNEGDYIDTQAKRDANQQRAEGSLLLISVLFREIVTHQEKKADNALARKVKNGSGKERDFAVEIEEWEEEEIQRMVRHLKITTHLSAVLTIDCLNL